MNAHTRPPPSCDVNLPVGSIGFNKKGIQHVSPHEKAWCSVLNIHTHARAHTLLHSQTS